MFFVIKGGYIVDFVVIKCKNKEIIKTKMALCKYITDLVVSRFVTSRSKGGNKFGGHRRYK